MTLSRGQKQALEQLKQIAELPNSSLEIYHHTEPSTEGELLVVDVKIYCGHYDRADGGLPLRSKEHFCLSIPARFPFDYPKVYVPHTRFAGYSHVQWKRHLCLYQSPEMEWNPSDLMFGFLKRLDMWLEKGAINQLDPVGEPLHPPAVYKKSSRRIVLREDTPIVDAENWFGFANLNEINSLRFDLDSWHGLLDKDIPTTAVPAILLSEPFPFEYPDTVSATIEQLEKVNVNRELIMACLQLGAVRTEENKPMYVVIGTPMRGISGAGNNRKQHLAVWEIEANAVDGLKLIVRGESLLKVANENNIDGLKELVRDIRNNFDTWANNAVMSWCHVLEAREEIINRRDSNTPMTWFYGKKVVIWGCGALGGAVAESIARAGASEFILRDNSIVNPGLIQRQNYTDQQIAYTKSSALRTRLLSICPTLKVSQYPENIITTVLESDDWSEGADIVIDATASNKVQGYLEAHWRNASSEVPIASIAINAYADCGLLTLAMPGHSGGPYDVYRRTGISVKDRQHLHCYADTFWPHTGAIKLIQPEPGCSDPTFRGSHADTTTLAGLMINQVAKDLTDTDQTWSARGHLIPASKEYPAAQTFSYLADHRIQIGDAEVRITDSAWRDMNGWIARSARVNGLMIETGGLLFGEFDEAVNVLWVNELIGPPPDSSASERYFECGYEGTLAVNKEVKKRSREAISYLGTWHTHPISDPIPSETDFMGMAKILAEQDLQISRQLLLIVGHTTTQAEIGAHIFQASMLRKGPIISQALVAFESGLHVMPKPKISRSKLGLTLSGGGSRAIAFHLGCLRALNDLGLLPQIDIISAVSGGSVITAKYVYEENDFEEFDKQVIELLRKGLEKSVAKQLFWSSTTPKICVTILISGISAFFFSIIRRLLTLITFIFNIRRFDRPDWIDRLRAPLRRWFSITSAFEMVISKIIGKHQLTSKTRNNMDVIFNACEMRTGTAFRFSNKGSYSWRFGNVVGNDISVAHAVAASAAYPVILPAFDDLYKFEKKNEIKHIIRRAVITDGGVYDNLGITPLEPGRDSRYAIFDDEYDVIICCDAGAGQFGDQIIPYGWGSRMTRAFETTFRKVQDGAKARLHKYAETGDIKAFIYAYLGQQDYALPCAPATLVPREDVSSYPTDFSAMPDEYISAIADRGEVLTRYLVSRYFPDD